jgi:glycosyltransferase involved in cell wall biosynthesis
MKVVGVFGRLSHWKGQHLAIEAVAELPGVHLLLVGDALFGEDEYVSQLQNAVADYEISDRVHWLGFRDDVPELMQACDIVLHCSTAPEPFGRVIAEGMFAGRAVIASNAGGATEIINHQETGLLTKLGCAAAIREAIQWYIDNSDQADAIAKRGREDVLKRFDIDDKVREINEIICEVNDGL